MKQIFITPLPSNPKIQDTFFVSNANAVKIKITNADRIRVLTDEELANRIVCHVSCSCCPLEQEDCQKHCYELWLEWLRKEAE